MVLRNRFEDQRRADPYDQRAFAVLRYKGLRMTSSSVPSRY